MNEYLTRVELVRATIADITQALSETKVAVRQRGMVASVEYNKSGVPTAVNLPYLPDNASDELIDAVQGFLDHEVGHLLFTDPKALAAVGHDAELITLTNVIEDPFVENKMRTRFPGSKHNFNRLFNFFLDKVVDKNYQEVKALPSSSPMKFFSVLIPAIARSWYGVEIFSEYLRDKWVDVQPILDKINSVDPALISEFGKAKSTQENVQLARRLLDAIYWVPPKDLEEREDDSDSDSEGKIEGSGGAAGGLSSSSSPRADEIDEESIEDDEEPEGEEPDEVPEDEEPEDEEPEDEEPGEESEGEESEGEESEDEESEDEEPGEESDEEPGEESDEESDEEPGEESESEDFDETKGDFATEMDEVGKVEEAELDDGELSEDEPESLCLEDLKTIDDSVADEIASEISHALKDSKYIVPTTEFDVIEPAVIHDRNMARHVIQPLIDEVDDFVGQMTFDLERTFLSMNKSYFRPGQYSGSLNSSALSRLHVGDSRVFRRKVNQKTKDYDVSLLIDLSGSMNNKAYNIFTRMQMAVMTSLALSTVLDKLDINFEVLGFTTGKEINFPGMKEFVREHALGRVEQLHMPVFKPFSEKWSIEHEEAMAWPLLDRSRMRNNVDGECLSIAAARLMTQKASSKALIVLSDGAPLASSHAPGALSRHLKATCERIESSGVRLIGIGLGTDSVAAFYKNHIIVKDPKDLPSTMIQQIKEIITESVD